MTEQPRPQGPTITLPPQSANGNSPQLPPAPKSGRIHTLISGMRTRLIVATAGIAVVMIFIIQNAHTVSISFLGAHLRLSLSVALLLAAIVGALIMAAGGTARIAQLRRIMRHDRRKPHAS